MGNGECQICFEKIQNFALFLIKTGGIKFWQKLSQHDAQLNIMTLFKAKTLAFSSFLWANFQPFSKIRSVLVTERGSSFSTISGQSQFFAWTKWKYFCKAKNKTFLPIWRFQLFESLKAHLELLYTLRFPTNLGFVYENFFATSIWEMQNVLHVRFK